MQEQPSRIVCSNFGHPAPRKNRGLARSVARQLGCLAEDQARRMTVNFATLPELLLRFKVGAERYRRASAFRNKGRIADGNSAIYT